MSNRSGLLSSIWQQLKKITRYQSYKEKIIGKDIYDNTFYETNQPNFRGQPTRYHFPPTNSDMLNKISPEWDAWLRYRRQEPPSEDEVLKNLKISEMKKVNADEKQRQFIRKYPHMNVKKSNVDYNEFNESYPKHKDIETNPGESKKR